MIRLTYSYIERLAFLPFKVPYHMKAAVLHEFGSLPRYEDFPDPGTGAGDVLIRVTAAVLENFDKMAAQGIHYASKRMFPQFPAIVGHSGVGTLANGTLVAFAGSRPPYGTMAEIAVVPKEYAGYVSPVPEGVDAGLAAALPASALTSYLPLKWGAKLEPGQSLLILGATGVSGKLAVRIAALLGAGKVVAAGRESSILGSLRQMGADAIIDLKRPDAEVYDAFVRESSGGYDVVLDFLWGHPAELLFKAITPGEAGFAKHRTRYIQIGQAAGAVISFAAEALRTSGLELSGVGNVPPEALPQALEQVWTWVRERKLTMDIEKVDLSCVTEAWVRKATGKRIVIMP
jgi:NADPH:quinone reductase-like Zn-dependent oxidoreductase